MLLRSVIDGKEDASIVLIEDTLQVCGKQLLACFAAAWSQRKDEVKVITTGQPCSDWQRALSANSSCRLTVDTLKSADDVRRIVCDSGATPNSGVVVDDVSCLALHCSCTQLCRWLHSLTAAPGPGGTQVVCLVHTECLPEVTLSALRYVSSCVIRLRSRDASGSMRCDVTYRRPSGKVIRSTHEFSCAPDLSLSEVRRVEDLVATESGARNEASQADPAANLTFNLKLNEEQKAARSRVQLPYHISVQSQDDQLEGSVSGRGDIFYQPDDADDFDEEDPDDDLNI